MKDSIMNYEHMWTTEVDDYVIRRIIAKKLDARIVVIESIIHPKSSTVLLIEDGVIEEELIERMKNAGVKITEMYIEDNDE